MSYATHQNMIDRFGVDEVVQLTDRANTGALDAQVLDQALSDADDTINGYLSGRYTLPFASVPKVLTRLACDIARYLLYRDQASDRVKDGFDAAIAFLKSVAAGTVQLGLDAANAVPSVGAPVVSGPDRQFTNETLKDF